MLLISAFSVASLLSPELSCDSHKGASPSELIQEKIGEISPKGLSYFKEVEGLIEEINNKALNSCVLDFKSYKDSKNLKRTVEYLTDLEQRLIKKESQIKAQILDFEAFSKNAYIKKRALELATALKKSQIEYDSNLVKQELIKSIHESLLEIESQVLQPIFAILHETLQEYTKIVAFFIDQRGSYSLHDNQIFFMRNGDYLAYTNMMEEFEQSLQDKRSAIHELSEGFPPQNL